jgi:ribosomal protein S27AE
VRFTQPAILGDVSITDGFCDDCGAYVGEGPESRDSCPNCGAVLDDENDYG